MILKPDKHYNKEKKTIDHYFSRNKYKFFLKISKTNPIIVQPCTEKITVMNK